MSAHHPTTLVLVGHGTRDPAGVAAIETLAARVRALRPRHPVALAWLDLARPTLAETLHHLTGTVVLVPLLLATGHHLRVDLPAHIAAARHLRCLPARALGPHPLLAEAVADLLGPLPPTTPVVLAAAGSTDPDAAAETTRTAALLAHRTGRRVLPAHLCATGPTPAEVVAALRARGHRHIALARHLLAPGHFARRAEAAGADQVSAPLAQHPALARLILLRHEEALRSVTHIPRAKPFHHRAIRMGEDG
ncbi:sirohydrochlorin chelatase [Streptomyces sp. BI20]|uniref:sirohydrochlorin chelatase n=1 Tax=Streptomyces sp. BI20 TaxID=3403460 RepID=UPI003C77D6AA